MTRHSESADALRRLLAFARDLLQASDLDSAIDLAGSAIQDLLVADSAILLVVLHDGEHVAEFDRRGRRLPTNGQTPLYQHARRTITSQNPHLVEAGLTTLQAEQQPACLLATPFPPLSSMGVVAACWSSKPRRQQLTRRLALLRYISGLTAAALGNVEAKQALQGFIWAKDEELSAANRRHEQELRKRDAMAEEMQRMSITDVLTGMANRRGFFLHAEHSFKLAQRQGVPSALIFADIDGLKAVNDEWGHDVGDHLIQDSAYILRKSFRSSDVVARLGGDEFAAFTLDDVRPEVILDRIQGNMHDFNLRASRPYQVSFSTGIVQCDPRSGLNLQRYLALADEQMYVKKRLRRSDLPVNCDLQ